MSVPQIYDIFLDEMRDATQQDIDDLQRTVQHLVHIRHVIELIATTSGRANHIFPLSLGEREARLNAIEKLFVLGKPKTPRKRKAKKKSRGG